MANSAQVIVYRAEMQCTICTREWVAIFTAGTRTLECPTCGYDNVAPPTPGNRAFPPS